MIVAHAKDGSPPWHQWYKAAFRQGFASWAIEFSTTPADVVEAARMDDVHIVFGPNYWPKTIAALPPEQVIMVNRCFAGKVEDWVALSWGGFNGYGRYATGNTVQKTARYDKWNTILPDPDWAGGGGYAVIVGEYPSAADSVHEINQFYKESLRECNRRGWKPIFRPHPAKRDSIPGATTNPKADITKAEMVFTHSSTFGVEARLRGCPVTTHPASVASFSPYSVGSHNRQWEEEVLMMQWHIDEIKTGEFWRYLNA